MSLDNNNTPPGQEVQGRASLSDIKKRGRKTNDEIIAEWQKKQGAAAGPSAAVPSVILQGRHVEGLTNIPFAGIAWLTKETAWNLSKDEQEFLSSPLADFLNEILPELAKKYPRGAILAICFVSVATKKIAEISQKAPKNIIPQPERPRPGPVTPAEPGADGLTAVERNLRARERGALAV